MTIRSFDKLAQGGGLGLFVIALAMLVAADPAFAQNYPYIAPQMPPPGKAGTLRPPSLPESRIKDGSTVLVPKLNGIKLVGAPGKVLPTGIYAHGVFVDDAILMSTMATDTYAGLKAFLGLPLTRKRLQALKDGIVNWYRLHDHPLVDVVVPEQDISSGVVQLVVLEFRVGNVRVAGNEWFTEDQVADGLRLKPGDTVDYGRLRDDVAWLNQNPFRSVDAVFAKGNDPGTTDLELKTKDAFPMRLYAGYDNSGAPIIGRSRYSLGANWGNAFWANQLLSYQFTSSGDFWAKHGDAFGGVGDARFLAHSIDDIIPLPWHDKIDIFGAYSREIPQLPQEFNQRGYSGQASIRYIHPLPAVDWFSHEIQFGYDYKTTNNNLQFAGTSVFASSTDIHQFQLVYKVNERDEFGRTDFADSLVMSPGGLSAGNTAAAFQASGVINAAADYLYDHVEVARTTPLFGDRMTAVTRLAAQISNGNLLPSEQLGAGGENSVRGYDERVVNASQGFLMSQELRSPVFDLSKTLLGESIGDKAQFLTFWDFGSLGDNTTQPGQPESIQLSSVGVGARVGIGDFLSIQADYGFQLNRLPTADSRGSLAHIALTLSH